METHYLILNCTLVRMAPEQLQGVLLLPFHYVPVNLCQSDLSWSSFKALSY
jgi:hypothetical protein